MNWDDVRLFLAVARTGSVSGAGERLGMHHTNVARRMRAFEEGLGARLFHRSKAGYRLTTAGEGLLAHAEDMEARALAIDRSLAGLDTALSGRVTVTANQDLLDILITPHIAAFHARHPGICLDLLATSRQVSQDAGEADLALRLTANPEPHLIGRRLSTMAMGVYCSPAYQPRSVEGLKVVAYSQEQGLPPWVRGVAPDAVVTFRGNSLRTTRAALRAGLGVATMPCFYGDADPTLRRIDLPLQGPEWGIWLLVHADLRTNARVAACRAWLLEILAEQRGLLAGAQSRWVDEPLAGVGGAG